MEPVRNSILLELHVPDFAAVKEYYGKLGFEVAWERKPEDIKGYLIMKMGDSILCFWCGNEKVYEQPYFQQFPKSTKRGYGVEVIIMVDDVGSYYAEIKDFANVVEPLTVQPWGLKDFRVEDPFGYYLRFTSPHNILDNDNAVE